MEFDLPNSKGLSFSQRAGLADLPSQLRPGEISAEFRAHSWAIIYLAFEEAKYVTQGLYGEGPDLLKAPYDRILQRFWLYKLHRPMDEYSNSYKPLTRLVKETILEGSWNSVLDFIEFLLRDPGTPEKVRSQLIKSFRDCRLAYDVADRDTIIEVSGPEHAEAVELAIDLSRSAELVGVTSHLKGAGALLTDGDWAGSIRESVHSIESLVRQVTNGKRTFAEAIKQIEKSRSLHPQLKKAFENLYNYSSDEGGLRHPYVDEPKGPIDENLALFFHHACAAFIGFVLRLEN